MLLRRGIEEATAAIVAELAAGRADGRGRRARARRDDRRQGGRGHRRRRRRGADACRRRGRRHDRGVRRARHQRAASSRACVVENGWLSQYMVRDPHRMETVFENPYVFMTNKALKHPNDLLPILNALARDPRPLVILCENAEASALGMLVSNTQHGTLEAVAVRAPGFGHRRIQHLGDIAAFCGGTVIAEEAGLSLDDVTLEHFGTARRVIVTADDCTFIEGGGTDEAVAGRLAQLRVELGARGARSRRRDPAGADRPALGQAGRDPRRRAVRGRPAGALPAHRGRAGRDPGGDVRGRRPGRRHRAAALGGRAGRADARGRLRARRGDRRQRARASRCTGSPPTPATTGRRRSTRSARCPTGTA